jgi:hypothetical protein
MIVLLLLSHIHTHMVTFSIFALSLFIDAEDGIKKKFNCLILNVIVSRLTNINCKE